MTLTSDGTKLVLTTRKAVESDAAKLLLLSEKVKLGWSESKDAGFLISNHSIDYFQKRICSGQAAVAELRGEVCGYLSWIPWDDNELKESKKLLETIPDLQVDLFSLANVAWLDSMAIDQTLTRKGVASALYGYILDEEDFTSFVGAIVESPMRNRASIEFHLKQGFSRVGTFRADEFCGISHYQSGIYFLSKESAL